MLRELSNSNSTPSTTENNFWKVFWSKCTLKRSSHADFKTLLIITMICGCILITFEVLTLWYPGNNPGQFESVTGYIAMALAALNVGVVYVLIVKPTTTLSLVSCGLIVTEEIVNFVQAVVYFSGPSGGDDDFYKGNLAFAICGLSIQLFAAFILYRYWEFVMFNYDDGVIDFMNDRDSNMDNNGSEMRGMSRSLTSTANKNPLFSFA